MLTADRQRQLSVVNEAVTVQIVLLEQPLQCCVWVVHASLLQHANELVNIDSAGQLMVKVLEHFHKSLVLGLLSVTPLAQLLLDVFLEPSVR